MGNGTEEFWARLPEPPGKRMQVPQELPEPEGDPVDAFTVLMRRELRANEHKGDREHWRQSPPKSLLLDISWHTIKLGAAMRAGDLDGIGEYTADLGNCAMMIADAYGLLS